MKVFQPICILCKPLGIDYKSNSGILVTFFFLTCYAVFSSAYFLVTPNKTNSEFIQSFYVSVTTIAHFFYFVIIIWKKPSILRVIENFENFIGKRKFKLHIVKTRANESNIFQLFFVGLFQGVNIQRKEQLIWKSMKKPKNGRNYFISCCWKFGFRPFWYQTA